MTSGQRSAPLAPAEGSGTIRPLRPSGLRALLDPLHRLAYMVGFRCARVVWGLTRPHHRGALVAIRVGDATLVLRQSYRREWSLPGGGIGAGETPVAAAIRELREELGLDMDPALLRCVHTATGLWDGRRDTVTFFELALPALPPLRLDNREVAAACLVAFDGLEASAVTPAVGAYLAWRRSSEAAPQ